MTKFVWTNEQMQILSTETLFLLIKAFAGTGKTSTLIEYARLRPDVKFLNLTFASSIAEEARKKFPQNTTSQTAHALAYKEVGYLYQNKLGSKIKTEDIVKIIMLGDNGQSRYLANIIKDIIDQYCYSGIKDIKKFINTVNVDASLKDLLKSMSDRVWNKIIDLNNDYQVTHDIYFKVYLNKEPILPFDCIFLDEAQDANDALKTLLVSQVKYNKRIILVGDSHQAIYKFRGSKNILNHVVPTKELSLTHSFRFGKNIAFIANKTLGVKGENLKIIGSDIVNDSLNNVDYNKKYTSISRTNSGVLARAMSLIGENKKIFFVDGIKSYQFYKVKDVEHLYLGRFDKIKDLKVKQFVDFKILIDESKTVKDRELIILANLVLKYNGNVSLKLKQIEDLTVTSIDNADVVLTNVHKSKGLEFDQVVLGNDFINLNYDNYQKYDKIIDEELNILYVALTRAKYKLQLNNTLKFLEEL